MEKITIIFIILLLFIVGIFILVYFMYEKPIQQESNIPPRNVSIKITNGDTQVSTNFLVLLDSSNEVYYNGNSTKYDYTIFTIPSNRTFTIYNANLENQNYYTSKYVNLDLGTSNVRVNLDIKSYPSVKVNYEGVLGIDNPINLIIFPNDTFQYLTICMRWSEHVISADITDLQRKEPPKRLLSKVDRCYITEKSISSKTFFPITYKTFGDVENKDYLEFYIIDGDMRYYTEGTYVIEGTKYEDIGSPDIYYKIDAFKN